ncbi:hypothetical protein [Bifidobacterium myosotis]
MSTAINDDAYRFAPAISLHDPPPEESEVTCAPMRAAESVSENGPVPAMGESVAQRKRDTARRCTEVAKRLDRRLLFGMTTSLALQSVPLPADCDLDQLALHAVCSTRDKRIRARNEEVRTHIWRYVTNENVVRINRHVFALDLFHVWAQMAVHVPLESLVVLGDAIITATAKQPSLANNRDILAVHRDFAACINGLVGFKGRSRCLRALDLVVPGADSPKETEERISLLSHGIPQPAVNYTVPDALFDSGFPMTLDMAWPEYKVAVEYDGDHHRTSKTQWRRDREKRDRLIGRRWTVFVATAASLADEDARAEFAFNVARELARRGAVFEFRVIAMTIEQLAERRLKESRRRS